MTLGDIAVKARFLSNTDSTSYPDVNILIDINIWYQKVVSMILESADEANFADTNDTNYPLTTRLLVAAQRDYAFGTALWTLLGKEGGAGTATQTLLPLKIKRLDVAYDGTNYYKATPFDDGTSKYGMGNASNDDQYFVKDAPQYDVKFNSIFLYPMATAADVTAGAIMRLEQERNVIPFTSGQLTAGTVIPGFDAPFHPILAEGAALEYGKARAYPQVEDWEKNLQDWEARLRTAYGRKNLDNRLQFQNQYDDSSFR